MKLIYTKLVFIIKVLRVFITQAIYIYPIIKGENKLDGMEIMIMY